MGDVNNMEDFCKILSNVTLTSHNFLDFFEDYFSDYYESTSNIFFIRYRYDPVNDSYVEDEQLSYL